MHTAHHLGRTCKFIMAASTLHTKFLSHMPQILLADRHKHNYCLLANCLRDFSHPDQPAASRIYSIQTDHTVAQQQYQKCEILDQLHCSSALKLVNSKQIFSLEEIWSVMSDEAQNDTILHSTERACLHMGSFSDQTPSIQATKSVITLTI